MTNDAHLNLPYSGFNTEWELRYSEDTHLSVWPWSDLVSYISRNAKPNDSFKKVLELGCGAGANIPFFSSRGDEYFAIEGSKTIVNQLKKKFPQYSENIVAGDFTKDIPFNTVFDVVFDRAGLTCNDTKSILYALIIAQKVIRKDGLFIGIDWYSQEHSDSKRGIEVDEYTRREIESGPFLGLGNIHFSDEQHLTDLFSDAGFEIISLEHKQNKILLGQNAGTIHCAFNFVARKI